MLLDREAELAVIDAALDDAFAGPGRVLLIEGPAGGGQARAVTWAALDDAFGGRGRVLLIEGPAGIGKTRLLEALRSRGRDRGAAVLGARASELDRDFPLGVVRQLFEPLLARAGEERRAELL